MSRFLSPAWRGVLWSLFSSLNFALMGVITKASAQHFPFSSNELATWRNLPATLALGGFALLRGQRFATQHLRAHVIRSVSGGTSTLIYFYTLTLLPLATAVTLGYSSAIFLALLSFILLHEHITHRTVAVLIIGLMGVVVLLRPGFSAGQAWGLSCGLFGAAATGLAHLQLREMSAMLATVQGWHAPPLASLPYLLGIGVSGLTAQLALTRAYAVGQKFTVAALSYLTVVYSVVFGHYLFRETLGWQEMAGIAIIISAGLVSITRNPH